MPRRPEQMPGEVRDGLIKYPNGKTWHYLVRWRGEIRRGDTKCTKRTAAAAWLEKERENWPLLEQGLIGPRAPTLKEIWQAWDESKAATKSKSHLRWMRNVVFLHASNYLDRPAPELNQAALDQLRSIYLTTHGKGFKKTPKEGWKEGEERFTQRRHSEGGWNKVAGQLRALFRWAVSRKKILEMPFQIELEEVSLQARGVLWPELVQPFLRMIDTKIRLEREEDPFPHPSVSLRLMIGLGLRENEALHLEWDRVDWRRHVVVIAQARSTGRKVKDRTIREIPMVDWLEAFLLKWWAHCERPSSGLLLVSRKGKAHGEGATGAAVERAARDLKILGLTPHRLRATFATNLYELGTPLTQIQQMLGHDKPETTLRYIVQRPKDQAESLEKAGRAMGFSEGPVSYRVPLKKKRNYKTKK